MHAVGSFVCCGSIRDFEFWFSLEKFDSWIFLPHNVSNYLAVTSQTAKRWLPSDCSKSLFSIGSIFWKGLIDGILIEPSSKESKIPTLFHPLSIISFFFDVLVTVYLSGYTGWTCLILNLYFQHIKNLLQSKKVT